MAHPRRSPERSPTLSGTTSHCCDNPLNLSGTHWSGTCDRSESPIRAWSEPSRQPPVPTSIRQADATNYGPRMVNRYEYRVVELREGMIGGKMSGDKVEQVLNEHAAQGWQLKALTSVEVKGRVGPGAVEGILVTFERQVG